MDKFPIALAGLSLDELEEQLSSLPRYRSSQIYKWIACGAHDFDEMSNLPKELREELSARFVLYSGHIVEQEKSESAEKIAICLKDGLTIESVLLKDSKGRLTACLSTQAGCPAGCVFCKTGTLGFARNLDAAEIVEQFLFLCNMAYIPKIIGEDLTQRRKDAKAQRRGEEEEKSRHIIDNIVVMGMGEPLLNLDALRGAIEIFTDAKGFNFSRRRITVSTCGICDGLFDLAEKGPYVRLALSLATADEPLRKRLMPVTAANPLAKVKEALIAYQRKSGSRITLELPLLGGVNTRDKDAESVALFAQGLDTIVNIIPWNPVAGLEFEGKPLCEPGKEETEKFAALLESKGLKVTMRRRKGRGVNGACGQLGSCGAQVCTACWIF